MSFINGSPLAGMGGTPSFAYEPQQNENFMERTPTGYANYGGNDGFQNNPIALPIQSPGFNFGNFGGSNANGNSATGTSSSDNSFFAGIMQSLSNLMSQISSYFGQSSQSTGTGATCNGSQNQSQETAFNSATASSVGDPHDSLSGTTANGTTENNTWDSMQSHGDLLDSDSFRGGYQVSTTTTTPNAKGVTYNASATVTTNGGNDAVTLDKDGSYQVTANGHNVSLTQGQATQLGHGESVTLNADNSLTVVDANYQGGSLTTTLSNNGNGVDVKASGTQVDLGGYLVNKTDGNPPPVAYQNQNNDGWGMNGTPSYNLPTYAQNSFESALTNLSSNAPYEYGGDTEPLGAGEIEFA